MNPMRIQFLIISIALFLVGCSSPGILISRQVAQSPPKMGKVPADGTYGLFIAGESQDLFDLPLKTDDPIGFDWAEDGTVKWMYAVAGPSKNRLDVTKTYEWRRLP